MFITKKICEKMHGQIKAFSRENYGSCFVICIPVETAFLTNSMQVIEQADVEPVQNFSSLKAMVVDDDSLSLIVLKTFLAKLDITVGTVAQNGLEGVKKYSELIDELRIPDIVTMDLEMPVMDGKKAAEKIRELERVKHTKPCLLIVVSGNCSKSEIAECMDPDGKIRADVFLKKPVRIEDLTQAISEKIRV